jgi:Histidine kinase/Histidine kinase-, DNA gyrase B-, and HSP90-like ATPase
MNLPESPIPTPSGGSPRLAWLKRVNTSLSQWAATLSWWRMAVLALIVLIAGSWISEKLQLSHDREPQVKVKRIVKKKLDPTGQQRECEGEEIRIGGVNGIVFCEGRRVSKAAAPAAGASGVPAPSASAAVSTMPVLEPGPAPGASEPSVPAVPASGAKDKPGGKRSATITIDTDSDTDNDSDNEEEATTPRKVHYTLGGWVGDLLSAALVALFAYLIAAKVLMRKTAEADAKVKRATTSAEHEAMQRQLVQARLKLLQAQVEPHFLFNTLAAVDYLIETDAKRASVMQKTLISYLRAALPQMRQESSTLGREVKLIRAYLELLKLRIEDRLEFDIKIPQNLESAVFPPMVLQTVVENAIKHGIEPKSEGGKVTVLAEVVDGQLRVDVVDTGVGLPEGDIFGNTADGNGLGLDNIRNRLSMLYPGASRMELSSGYDGGTLVRLTIPFTTETPASGAKSA